jgi:predicted transposase YbfD/YdcC
LLKHLDLKGALLTMDAMGTQTEIARAIRDGGGVYCTSLKKNWPAVYADVEQLFNEPPDDVVFETKETVDLTGRRIEARRHTVCHKVDWMTADRHYQGEPVFHSGASHHDPICPRHAKKSQKCPFVPHFIDIW